MLLYCVGVLLATAARVSQGASAASPPTTSLATDPLDGSHLQQHPLLDHEQFQQVKTPHPASDGADTTLYLGYGSNLWQAQMAERCPHALYAGVARLTGYRWIIYDLGYANIVETNRTADVVYGLVYLLTPSDEASLDSYEGVARNPPAYSKELIPVSFWPSKTVHHPLTHPPSSDWVDVTNSTAAIEKPMLCYINRNLTDPAQPKTEYVARMNAGIKDASICGVPNRYLDHVIRKYIPSGLGDLPYY